MPSCGGGRMWDVAVGDVRCAGCTGAIAREGRAPRALSAGMEGVLETCWGQELAYVKACAARPECRDLWL